jgi:shikimate kinase
MKQSIVLIGMPGAGKTTVGVLLAKRLSRKFIDTDILIQIRFKKTLQDIMDMLGYMELRHIEENEILQIEPDNSVVATGGSAVYSDQAMRHLKENGTIIYLRNDRKELLERIGDFKTRGIAKSKDQTIDELFTERELLYEKYGEITIECRDKNHENIVDEIATILRNKN